jgi:hypothetical protein
MTTMTDTPDTLTTDAETTETETSKGGAPKGNRNSIRHGLRASSLPPGCSYLDGQLRSLRKGLRREIKRQHGDISLVHEASLQSALRHETRALLAARWLRIGGDELPLEQRLSLLAAISTATDARDRCLKLLRLDRDGTRDILATLYSPTAIDDDDAPDEPENDDFSETIDEPEPTTEDAT